MQQKRKGKREKEVWLFFSIFFLSLLLFYSSFLFGGKVLFGIDFSYQNLPAKAFFARTLREGAIPFWAKDLGLGFPLFAEGIAGVFYPFHLLFLVFPLHTAYLLCFALHLALFATLSFLFFRSIGISLPLSAGGGWLLGFSQLSLLKWLNFTESLSWLPLLLFLLVGKEAKRREEMLLGIALTLAYLPSHPQIALLNILIASPFFLLPFKRERWLPRLRSAGVALLIFFALSAFQILPQAELARESVRARGLPSSLGLEGSLPLPTLLFLFATLSLLPFSLLRRLGSRFSLPFFFASAIALLFAGGGNFPFYRFLYRHVPPFGGFTVPSRALVVGSILFLGGWLLLLNRIRSPYLLRGIFLLLFFSSLLFLKGNIASMVPFQWEAIAQQKLTPEEGKEQLIAIDRKAYDQVPAFLKIIKEDATFFRVAGHADGLFRPNLPLLWEIPTLGVYSPLALAKKKVLLSFDRLSLLQLVGTKYFVASEPLPLSEQRHLHVKKRLEKPIVLYELQGSFPRVWSVREVHFYPAEQPLLQAMLRQRDSFKEVAYIANYPLARRAKRLATAQIERVSETPNAISIRYRAKGKALLVINEQSYPGWKAKIAHYPSPPLSSVNLIQMAALVPAGEHTLRLTFLPTAFVPLFSLSLLVLGWSFFFIIKGTVSRN